MLVGYHGTDEVFDTFECPAYFADNVATAEFFAKRLRGEPRVLKCSIELVNPLPVDLGGQSWGGFFLDDEKLQNACVQYAAGNDAEELAYFTEEGLTINFLAEYAKYLGYDGLIATNAFEEDGSYGTQYVVFCPEKIKVLQVNHYTLSGDLATESYV